MRRLFLTAALLFIAVPAFAQGALAGATTTPAAQPNLFATTGYRYGQAGLVGADFRIPANSYTSEGWRLYYVFDVSRSFSNQNTGWAVVGFGGSIERVDGLFGVDVRGRLQAAAKLTLTDTATRVAAGIEFGVTLNHIRTCIGRVSGSKALVFGIQVRVPVL